MKLSISKINNISDYIVFLILIFTISTLFQGIIPFSLNRVVISIILFFIFIYNIKFIYSRFLLFSLYIIIIIIYNLFFSRDLDIAIKDLIYFSTTMIILIYLSSENNMYYLQLSFLKYKEKLSKIIYVVYSITILSLLVDNNYDFSWGSENYFVGFARDSHVMASSSCLLMAFMLFLFLNQKFSYIKFSILISILYIIFETGARTYIVPACIIIYLYLYLSITKSLKRRVLFFTSIISILFIFLNSGMYKKFMWSAVASNQGISDSLISSTGGRSAFWYIDIFEYINSPVFNIFVGYGFDYVYKINYTYYNMHIWAHNDIIDLLLSVGIIGTFYYIKVWFDFFNMNFKKNNNNIITLLFSIYIIFPMLFNGMFAYQHYFISVIIMAIISRQGGTLCIK